MLLGGEVRRGRGAGAAARGAAALGTAGVAGLATGVGVARGAAIFGAKDFFDAGGRFFPPVAGLEAIFRTVVFDAALRLFAAAAFAVGFERDISAGSGAGAAIFRPLILARSASILPARVDAAWPVLVFVLAAAVPRMSLSFDLVFPLAIVNSSEGHSPKEF